MDSRKKFWSHVSVYASLSISVLLITIKGIAWQITGSLSLLSSMVDSFMDIFISLMNILAVRYAWMPADEDHKFGHGKAEALVGLFQVAILCLAGFFVISEMIERFINPQPLTHSYVGFIVMGICVFFVIGLVCLHYYTISITKSIVVEGDLFNYMSDIASNLSICLLFLLSIFFDVMWLDLFVSAILVSFLFYLSYRLLRKSIHMLMDRELSDESKALIGHLILSVQGVKGFHRLRTRSSGLRDFIEFDLQMDGTLSLSHAHFITHDVIELVNKEFPNAEVVVHQEPEGIESHLDESRDHFWSEKNIDD